MNDKPDIVLIGMSFAFGLVVSAGGVYVSIAAFSSGLGDAIPSAALPYLWFGGITLGAIILGKGLNVPTDALLGGGILGIVCGFLLIANVVGWSFVMFAVVTIAILALVMGAWAAYEWHRRNATPEEPPYGTWRILFIILTLTVSVIPGLLLVV